MKSVSSWLTEHKFRDAECVDITYVGARQGISRATRPSIKCPQRYCASIHRLTQWRVTDVYGRNGVGGCKDAAKIVYSVY